MTQRRKEVDPIATLQNWLDAVLKRNGTKEVSARLDYNNWRENQGFAATITFGKTEFEVDKLQIVGRMRVSAGDKHMVIVVHPSTE